MKKQVRIKRTPKALRYRSFRVKQSPLFDKIVRKTGIVHLLGGSAFEPYECFAIGKASAQAEFISAEHVKFTVVSIKIATPFGVAIFMSCIDKKDAGAKLIISQ